VKSIVNGVFAVLASLWMMAAHAGALVDVTVVNRATGQSMPAWTHQGRLYVAGTPGEKYSVLVTNRTGARVLTVVSVDGINVITGETAAPGQSGYVLDPWGSVDISGWRKNMSEVAAFVFTALPDSYAARTERPDNVGVIGVAVFREHRPPRPRPPALQQPEPFSGLGSRSDEVRRSASGAARESALDKPAAPSADASVRAEPKPEEKLGTGHGEREASGARWTRFRRASESPSERLSVYYDSRANLMARGIIRAPSRAEPSPFPGFRFTPDPKG
jgi:hypothetical protein